MRALLTLAVAACLSVALPACGETPGPAPVQPIICPASATAGLETAPVAPGAVTAMNDRVTALEREMGTLNELKIAVGKIEAKQEAIVEQLRDLNASVRWLREPTADYAIAPKPRRRTRPTEDG
jgi:hypothetical protein